MSEQNTTQPTMTERVAAEMAHRATAEGAAESLEREQARALAADKIELHRRLGWGDDELARSMEYANFAQARLGLSDEDVAERDRFYRSRADTVEEGARIGFALAELPPDLSPAQAREIIADLRRDSGFFQQLHVARDPRAIRRWDALHALAFDAKEGGGQ